MEQKEGQEEDSAPSLHAVDVKPDQIFSRLQRPHEPCDCDLHVPTRRGDAIIAIYVAAFHTQAENAAAARGMAG